MAASIEGWRQRTVSTNGVRYLPEQEAGRVGMGLILGGSRAATRSAGEGELE